MSTLATYLAAGWVFSGRDPAVRAPNAPWFQAWCSVAAYGRLAAWLLQASDRDETCCVQATLTFVGVAPLFQLDFMRLPVFKITGAAICLLALLATLGVHWHLLQSVAWARMLADYSRTDSFQNALLKTFDGQHPCSMCVQIENGRDEEERERQESPWATAERPFDMFFEQRTAVAPLAPSLSAAAVPFIPLSSMHFAEAPPKPPPRCASLFSLFLL